MSLWQKKLLGKIAESIDYGVTASATEQPVGPQFLRITDIQDGAVNWKKVPWCECNERSASEARLKSGDIVFARTGATTGKSFLIRECPSNAVFASYLIRVRFGELIEPRFVSHFFQTPIYWSQITSKSRGVAQPGVNATTLKTLEIPLPPLPEQKRIAEVLDKADELRAKRRAALDKLDTLTQSIFMEMFGDPVTNPKEFPVLKMGEVCDVRDGTHDSPKYVSEGGYPLVTSKNLTNGIVDLSDVNYISETDYIQINRRSKVDCGDIIMPMIGTIGSPVIIEKEPFFAIKNVALIKFTGSSPLVEIIHHLLSCHYFDYFIGKKNRGGTQKFVSLGDLRSFPLPLPPLPLQREFANRITVVEELKSSHRASLEKLDALFASLQDRAFKGEL